MILVGRAFRDPGTGESDVPDFFVVTLTDDFLHTMWDRVDAAKKALDSMDPVLGFSHIVFEEFDPVWFRECEAVETLLGKRYETDDNAVFSKRLFLPEKIDGQPVDFRTEDNLLLMHPDWFQFRCRLRSTDIGISSRKIRPDWLLSELEARIWE